MITKKTRHLDMPIDSSAYASRYDLDDLTQSQFSENSMPAQIVKQFIEDELKLESQPLLNLASFVTTWMEPEADELIQKCLNKNFIDHDEYPETETLHRRCIHMLAELLHAPDELNYAGTACVGSSEAIMLAGLAHKFNWINRNPDLNKNGQKPNIVMGGNVQICWDKFARYFDVEPRIIPLKPNQYTIKAKDVASRIDDKTICVAAVLGTTFTGEYDEIYQINQLLIKHKQLTGQNIPLHVDAASGGFISMFREDGIQWDFNLEQVQSINISGHKYGLVYPGVGWLMFKDEQCIPQDLIFEINYLGGSMPTYTLNFSRGSAMIVAQYYNFLRLGRLGYQKIVHNMMEVSNYLVTEIESLQVFKIEGSRRMEPVVTFSLSKPAQYTVFDIARVLSNRGWVVPAYTLPADAEQIACLRIVVKENMSITLANDFICALKSTIEELNHTLPTNSPPKIQRKAKHIPH